jgi:hypothetical protein
MADLAELHGGSRPKPEGNELAESEDLASLLLCLQLLEEETSRFAE